jgi:hypothetical protein
VAVPNSLKIPPLEHRKKRGFCKYHNFLGHKISHCVLFRDLGHKTSHLRPDDAMYTASCNVVEAIMDVVEKISVESKVDVAEYQMVEAYRGPKSAKEVIAESQFDEKARVAYPMAEEELVNFLDRCRLKNFEVMLCPMCSSVFDKEATKSLEGFITKSKKIGKWSADHRQKFSFTKSYIPFINNSLTTNYFYKNGRGKTYVPHAKAPVQKWVHSTHKNV